MPSSSHHPRFLAAIALLVFMPGALSAQGPNRPFPQHAAYTVASIRPTNISAGALDDSVRAFYDRWKGLYLAPGCVPSQYYIRGGTEMPSGLGVSEGQGFGMVITAFMAGHDPDAKAIFDGLYGYFRAHPSEINRDLMAWRP